MEHDWNTRQQGLSESKGLKASLIELLSVTKNGKTYEIGFLGNIQQNYNNTN